MVSMAEARLEGSATLCAVSLTVAGFGRICGAVKLPFVSTVPHAKGHAVPASDHSTAVSGCPPLVIVAWNPRIAPSSTAAAFGASAICKSLTIVTAALADFVPSA
jgi:hypothetical protein